MLVVGFLCNPLRGDLRETITIPHASGWQYAETGTRHLDAPPTGGWQTQVIRWPNLHWQRRTLNIPANWWDRRIILNVGAAAHAVTVYVNDQFVGTYQSPATPYVVDITDYLNPSGSNMLMLGLENWSAFLKPEFSRNRNDFNFSAASGTPNYVPPESVQGPLGYAVWLFDGNKLWTREMALKAVPSVRVDDVFVQPSVRNQELVVEFTLRNDSGTARTVTLHNHVTDWQDDALKLSFPVQAVTIPAESETVVTVSVPWQNPQLWSPLNPHLYELVSSLRDGETVLDTLATRFGFREIWIEKSADNSRSWIVLNGNRQNFRGDGMWHPYLGVAYTEGWMGWLKANNFNTLRISNGGLPAYYRMADEKGLLIQSEIPFMFNHRYDYASPLFWERAEKMLREQIRAYRNHPSVVFWGVQNEVILTSPGKAIGANMFVLQQAALEEDPTRLVMHEGDVDLRTNQSANSTRYDVQIINTHDYEVEAGRAGGVLSIMDFPNAAYAYGNATNVATLPSFWFGTILPDKSKPWFIGEFGPGVVFSNPHGMSFFRGDEAFTDLFGESRGLSESVGLYYGFQIDGYRYFDHISGIAPWGLYFGDPSVPSGPVVAEFFKPVTVRIKEWTHNFFAGDTVVRNLVIHNDDVTETSHFQIDWQLVRKDEILLDGSLNISAEPGFSAKLPLSFVAPTTQERFEATLLLELYRNGALTDTRKQEISVFPARSNLTVPPGLPVYVRDPNGATANALAAAGINFTSLASINMTGRTPGLLVIGFAGYGQNPPAADVNSVQNWIQQGGTVLVNSDQWHNPPWLSFYGNANFDLTTNWVRSTIGFIRAPHHPVMQYLRENDFMWWGNDHYIVSESGANLTKPSAGFATVLVDTGGRNLGLGDAPLAEYPDGQGSTLINRLLLFEKINSEPVTRVLLQNILNYADAVRQQPARKAVGVHSGGVTEITTVFNRMGLDYVNLDNLLAEHSASSLNQTFSTLIMNNRAASWTEMLANKEKIQSFVHEGGTLIIRRLTADRVNDAKTLMGLDLQLAVKPTQLQHPQLEMHSPDPYLDGISNDDTFWVYPTGYRNQGWANHPIVEQVLVLDENASVKGLLIEPSRTGQLQADSGHSYNIGDVTRDTGTPVEEPGYGLVRIRPPGAKGSYIIDQQMWHQLSNTALRRKGQRYLSALISNTRQTHTALQPLTQTHMTSLSALVHLTLPDGSRESVNLSGSGTLALEIGANGETSHRDSQARDMAQGGFVELSLQGNTSRGPISARLDPRRPSTGFIIEHNNLVPGRLDIPPFTSSGTARGLYQLHLIVDFEGSEIRSSQPFEIEATLHHAFVQDDDAFTSTRYVEMEDLTGDETGLQMNWDIFMPRFSQAKPNLQIHWEADGKVRLNWPTPSTWVLQSSNTLTPESSWTNVPGPYQRLETHNQEVREITTGRHFFRLMREP